MVFLLVVVVFCWAAQQTSDFFFIEKQKCAFALDILFAYDSSLAEPAT